MALFRIAGLPAVVVMRVRRRSALGLRTPARNADGLAHDAFRRIGTRRMACIERPSPPPAAQPASSTSPTASDALPGLSNGNRPSLLLDPSRASRDGGTAARRCSRHDVEAQIRRAWSER